MSIIRFRTTCSRSHEPNGAHSGKTFICAAVGVAVAVFVAAAVAVAAFGLYFHSYHDRLDCARYVAWQLERC